MKEPSTISTSATPFNFPLHKVTFVYSFLRLFTRDKVSADIFDAQLLTQRLHVERGPAEALQTVVPAGLLLKFSTKDFQLVEDVADGRIIFSPGRIICSGTV